MAEDSLITQEVRGLVGQEFTYTSPDEIGRAGIRKFALAIGDVNPLYLDEDYAGGTRFGGIIAPPTLVFETSQMSAGAPREDGSFADTIRLPPPLNRILRGGNEYQFFQPVRPEDVITARRKIVDIYEREGRSGRMVFVIAEARYTNQRDELLGINRETLIFLPAEEP